VEEFWWPFQLAAGCGFGRGTALGMTMRVAAASLTLLPGGGGVVFYCVHCSCVVALASARDVQLHFLIIRHGGALPLFLKKNYVGQLLIRQYITIWLVLSGPALVLSSNQFSNFV
jgi:hypothetical protein